MNPIIVISLFNKAEFFKSRNMLLKFYSKSRQKTITFTLAISVVILTLAVITNIHVLKWSFSLFLIAGLFLVINAFLTVEKRREENHYKKQTFKLAENYKENDIFLRYEISKELIKLYHNNKSISLKWKYFSCYTVYINYVILIPKLGSYLDAIIFENNSSDFVGIEKIVSSNLKKISSQSNLQ